MDPYLEQKGLWEEVHTGLIISLQQYLTPLLRPRYRVAVEQRTYLDLEFISAAGDNFAGKPDVLIVNSEHGRQLREAAPAFAERKAGPFIAELPAPEEVKERFLEIREVATGDVVTAIEVLSPSNKRPGEGRKEYEDKRNKVLGSHTHLIEIDLIRSSPPLPMRLRNGWAGDYRIVISRAHQRPRADVYAFTLRQSIPDFPVPLLRGDSEPTVPLNQLVHELYDRAGYDLAIDYSHPLKPSLTPEDAEWAATLLQPQK